MGPQQATMHAPTPAPQQFNTAPQPYSNSYTPTTAQPPAAQAGRPAPILLPTPTR